MAELCRTRCTEAVLLYNKQLILILSLMHLSVLVEIRCNHRCGMTELMASRPSCLGKEVDLFPSKWLSFRKCLFLRTAMQLNPELASCFESL